MNKILLFIILIVIVIGGGYVLMKQSKPATAPTNTTMTAPTSQTSPQAMQQASPSAGAMGSQLNIEGNEFAFTPAKLTVKKGEQVTITFKNTGKYPHNLSIADLNEKTDTIQPGESTKLTFTPNKVGTFTFECTVPGHADRGMKGTLTVE